MYIFSKLFTAFFLPPGIFIIALLIAGLLAKRFKGLFIALAALFYLLSIKPVANFLLAPLETPYKVPDTGAAAVVVLGGGSNPNGIIKAYPDAFKREFYGFYLAKEKGLPLIFSGGGIKKITEADNAKSDFNLIQSLSDANLTIYYENKSLNTKQNAQFTAKLFDKLKLPKKIYLVTSAYHIPRAVHYFQKEGFSVIPKAVNYKTERNLTFFDYLPNMRSLGDSYLAIHEYFGLLKQILSSRSN